MSEPAGVCESPLANGTVLGDRFEIVEHLGTGGFGEVYHAKQLLFGRGYRDVALKLFKKGKVNAENAHETLNDALLVMGLVDENPTLDVAAHLVPIYDMGMLSTPTPRAFVSMRLIRRGRTLKSEIYRFRHSGGMPVSLSLRYMRELLLPLAWMHSLETPALHGDLKPENVMLTQDSQVVLVDFGLAARMPLGVRGGTPAYDPSEKLYDLPGEPAADVYSAGLIWYELLTGQHPFKDVGLEALANDDQDAYRIAHLQARKWPICSRDELPVHLAQSRIAPASEFNDDLREQHPGLEALLNRCLADDLSERMPNARVLLDEIDAYIAHGGTFTKSELEVIGVSGTATSPHPVRERGAEESQSRLDDADALRKLDRLDQALAVVMRFIDANGETVEALVKKAEVLLEMPGHLEESSAVLEKLFPTAPKSPEVYEAMAKLREKQGKRAQAAQFRSEAMNLRRERRH